MLEGEVQIVHRVQAVLQGLHQALGVLGAETGNGVCEVGNVISLKVVEQGLLIGTTLIDRAMFLTRTMTLF